ncbi:MAG: hypothetical protein DWQ40_11105 [Actinobacteria bacterium]|nr:MAG: hypothetical protein DWQ40_11105 [Actinomycetota bacterium]
MYRLAELSDSRRKGIGWAMLTVGAVLLALAVWWIHFSSFPETEVIDGETVPVVLDVFNWVPRGWVWKSLGYLAAFAASQLLLAGAVFVFVLNQKMTWARALFAAFLAWIELVLIFGIVPSEWLNLAQTDLDWSSTRVALTIPPFLVLGNEVELSFAVLKDLISLGWHLVMIPAVAIFALQVQRMYDGPPAGEEKAEPKSPYGRPLVRGDS